jgi:nucleotide-binding universal stress UspA family protein
MYDPLLVALDGSDAAEQVLSHAEALAGAFGSRITLLRAISSAAMLLTQSTGGGPGLGEVAPAMDPTPILEAEQAAAAEYLRHVAERLQSQGLSVNTETPQGEAESVIVERARELGAALIVMTTHGRGGLGRVVFGSVADSVLRHAPCPVLLVRIQES